LPLPFDARQHRRIQRVALGPIPAFAGAHALSVFRGRFFHPQIRVGRFRVDVKYVLGAAGKPGLTSGVPGGRGEQNLVAEVAPAGEVPAGLRAVLIDAAKLRCRIERNAGSVASLVHANDSVVRGEQIFRHPVVLPQNDH
jgi:hypothetical protein